MMEKTRIESDSMGEVRVPSDAYFGAQTQRSLEHFQIGRDLMPKEIILAYGLLKKACAEVNQEEGKLSREQAKWILLAADEVISGKLNAHFPLSVWQTGSGTQTNMNFNEVIANRASQLAGGKLGSKEPIHPNDHVNMSQSSNDTFPTAIHIASLMELFKVISSLERLEKTLDEKANEFSEIIKIGRTHLQDATPLTLGQEFSGYVSLIKRSRGRIELTLDGLYDLAIGGTAVGTGLNAPLDFGEKVARKLKKMTSFPFRSHPNKFAALSSHDEMIFASGALRVAACSLMKIANDIRFLGSGPRCGLGELVLPENEPGSSFMPGKVNPTQCEAITMVAVQIMGNDSAVGIAGSQGNFELNVYKPVIFYNLIHSAILLKDAVDSFEKYCIRGLKANEKKIKEHLENSLMLASCLVPKLGYDRSTEIVKKAFQEHLTLKKAAVLLGYLSEKEFDQIVNPKKMISGSS